VDWSHHECVTLHSPPFLWTPVQVCTTLVQGKEGCIHCEVNEIGYLARSKQTSSSSEALEEYKLLDTLPPDIGRPS
jgi:hypothetical protein